MDQQVIDLFERQGVGDADGVVDRGAFEVSRDAGLADALGDGGAGDGEVACFDPAIEAAAVRVGQDDAGLGPGKFERCGHAGQGAASAAGAGERVNPALCLRKDFGARRGFVCCAVGKVAELVGPQCAGIVGQALADVDVVAGVAERFGRHEAKVGTDHAERVDLLLGLGVGHDDHGAVAAGIGDEGEADAGVACRPLDNGSAGQEGAATLGVQDDAKCGAILDGATGVHELRLTEDGAAGGGAGAHQTDEGRVANGADEAVGNRGGGCGMAHARAPFGGCWSIQMVENVSPRQAYDVLVADPRARLVDVRTDAEWSYVGLPELPGAAPLLIAWQLFPSGQVNGRFMDQLHAAGVEADAPVYFLCRSGVRSVAAASLAGAHGFGRAYNVVDGFEGPVDGAGHRGAVAGWKADGLPWAQR